MPAVQPPCKVLVTGANGYIAMWVVHEFLEQRYSVRGTVRSAKKAEHVQKQFAEYGDKLEVVVVEDITKEGAFDEVVKDVDAIAHTASPFHLNARRPEELIEPAVKGTVGILQSALKYGASVKRVVITSSVGAIIRDEPTPITFTEKDWDQQSLDLVNKLGEKAPSIAKYRASKTLAEMAAWKFVEEHKQEINWDVTFLNPPFVFGPAIHELTDPASLNTSAKMFYDYVADASKAEAAGNDFLAQSGTCWVDVRDVAKAHCLSLEKQEAGGERIIVSSGLFKWQDFIDAANALSPPPQLSKPIPKGQPGSGTGHPDTVHLVIFDTSKSDRVLGLKYRTIETTTKDTFADYQARGW
ncbi:hypothetical protein EDC04DRAFT_2082589 [Pisolithus marmoratus]|nr:hypothetical protein EDC04DRAFT_2082589 [Pisolithus marmoratus]